MNLTSIIGITNHPQVIWQITVDGKEIDSLLRRRLISLNHTDNRGFEADTVELDLDDSDGVLDLPPRGATIELAFGWKKDGLVKKGSYIVSEVAHNGAPDVLSIRAQSADMASGMTTQRERSWHDTTIGDIIRTIASENDLKPAVNIGLSEISVIHLDQTNESSANFLTRLALMHDAIASIKDGRLIFMPMGGGRSVTGHRIPAVKITRQSGDRHQFQIADRGTFKSVRALYNDLNLAVKGEVIWGEEENDIESGKRKPKALPSAPPTGQYKAMGSTFSSRHKALREAKKEWKRLKGNKAAKAAYIGVKAAYNDRNTSVKGEVSWGDADEAKKQSNASKLAQRDKAKIDKANIDQKEAEPANAFERTADNIKTMRHVYSSKANAQRAARAEWRRLQRGMATFNLSMAIGDPRLFPETPVNVAGFKPQIDSTDWIITRVSNSISGDGGYSQRLELEIKATEIPD
jgi:phage protein D